MKPEMFEFLKDLADVLEKHKGGLLYTTRDDGVYAMIEDRYSQKVCIGWPCDGKMIELRKILNRHTPEKVICSQCHNPIRQGETGQWEHYHPSGDTRHFMHIPDPVLQ